ncbi:hypothetical protein HPB50_002664 [Hyalomma asiaticum]|uniref:Uncharacterized protein n=1 Tax=Hyalomma asiaticum TaxID=266040 RepID=A0ACB7SJ33_HYAAI|nr:hypothetical protein HPB50_002664 [Hyalomma asiaticum]
MSSTSCHSQPTLSEHTEQVVSFWERLISKRKRDLEPQLEFSQYDAATNRRAAYSGTSATEQQRSRRTSRSSRPHFSLSGVNQYGVADTESLIAGRSFSTEGDAQVPSVHWVRALCLALMALASALFIGAVSVGLMHSLPATWPPALSRDAKVYGTTSRANPGKGKEGAPPVVQHAARLGNSPKVHVTAPTTASTATRASTSASGGALLRGANDKPDRCQRVFYKFCLEPRREFYFDPAKKTCVALSGRAGVEVCNRSPNRFVTALGCSRQCVRTRNPAGKCFKTALLSTCGRGDVVNGSNLWFFDGRGCHLWNFPSGKCPSRDGQLFSSVGRCLNTCVRRRARSVHSCRTPTPATCNSRQLKFPFFAADFGQDVSLRCLPTTTAGEAPRRCLAGANRFRTKAACIAACVRGRAMRAAHLMY